MAGAGISRFALANGKGYYAARRSEFYRVAQNVYKHLIQLQGVEYQVLVLHVYGIREKLQLLRPHLRTYHMNKVMDTLGKITILFLQ